MSRNSLWLLAALALIHVTPPCMAQLSLQQNLVAMVRVKDNDVVVDHGAALVVHQSDTRTLLVTAYHVLRERDGRWKGKPQVEFFGRRGTLYAATYNSAYADKELDLAVLFIDHSSDVRPPSLTDYLAQGLVSPSTEAALMGAPVRILGFMGQRPWASTTTSDRILSSNSRRVNVRSSAAVQGASGGAIVDSLSRLVAMASQIEETPDGPILQSVPLGAISNRLAAWGLPFDLRKTDVPSAGGAIALRLRNEMRLEATYDPQSPNDYLGGFGWRHLYRAAMPPDLAALVSHVDVEYTTLIVEKFTLRPPKFSEHLLIQHAIRVPFKQIVVLRDGRRLGPFETIVDLSAGPAEVAKAAGPQAMKSFALTLAAVQKNADGIERQRIEYEIAMSRNKQESLRREADGLVRSAKATYPRWRIRCRRIQEPTVDYWSCIGPELPMGGLWIRFLPASAVFEDVRLGSRQENITIAVPLAEEGFGLKFLEHAATMLKDGAIELYVTVRLVDGTMLGPKQLCVVDRRGGAGCV